MSKKQYKKTAQWIVLRLLFNFSKYFDKRNPPYEAVAKMVDSDNELFFNKGEGIKPKPTIIGNKVIYPIQNAEIWWLPQR